MQKNKRVCILVFSNVVGDIRVLREIEMARQHYQVDVIGFGDWHPPEGVRFISLPRKNVFPPLKYLLLFAGKINDKYFDRYFWLKPQYRKAFEYLQQGNYDLVHANDWHALPVAGLWGQQSHSKVLYDAHEYTPYQFNENILTHVLYRPYRMYLLNKYHSGTSAMIDASPEFSRLYKENFGWVSTTIMNTPYYVKTKFKPVDPSKINIIHHGLASPGRQQEELINMIKLAGNRFHLFLMIVPKMYPRYYSWLKSYAKRNAPNQVTFLDPVQPTEIVRRINQFDLGIPYLQSKQLNGFYSQPNKFFDFIMAGLGVITAPQKGMASIIDEYQVGCVSETQSIQAMADLLNSLDDEQINMFKKNSIKAAKELNAEIEMEKLRSIYQSMLSA